MLPELVRGMLDDAGRGDDRRGPAALPPGLTGKPPVLRRRTIRLLCALGLLAILYGTLVPFDIDPSRSLSLNLRVHRPASGDFVANILIYVPIGAFLRLMLRRRGSHRLWEWSAALTLSAGLAVGTEVLQTVVPSRVPSWTDAASNVFGAVLGILLAPALQRCLRNLHAWLYQTLRDRPLSAATAAAMICIWVHALAPFDIRPTPAHATRAARHFQAALAEGWGGVSWTDEALSRTQRVDKLMSAASYGLLAFLLSLSAREAGRREAGCAWYALSRTVLLAAGIEAIQLFTVSHAAEPADLVGAVAAGILGTGAATVLLTARPFVHQYPGEVCCGVLAVAAAGLSLWAALAWTPSGPAGGASGASWLPVVGNFHRTWDSLLGEYTTGLLRYTLIAALVALWSRSRRRRPGRALVAGGTIAAALLLQANAMLTRGAIFDSTQILLALLAAAAVLAVDRAIWGEPAAQTVRA